ncbi:MAG: hypothetical protein GX287_03415 [Fusobacteria bacterium]|nr:hypothetical protein [Fusobacteriota bacterium]
MDNYIFLTNEGYTYQPNSDLYTDEIENLQVIGISSGKDAKSAFYNLLDRESYLKETAFDDVFCYKLSDEYESTYETFSIKNSFNQEVE